MKIEEFIKKNSLTMFQSSQEDGDPAVPKYAPHGLVPPVLNDDYLIYTNGDQTIWVSKNTSKSLFRIRKTEKNGDLIFESDWLDANTGHKILN